MLPLKTSVTPRLRELEVTSTRGQPMRTGPLPQRIAAVS